MNLMLSVLVQYYHTMEDDVLPAQHHDDHCCLCSLMPLDRIILEVLVERCPCHGHDKLSSDVLPRLVNY